MGLKEDLDHLREKQSALQREIAEINEGVAEIIQPEFRRGEALARIAESLQEYNIFNEMGMDKNCFKKETTMDSRKLVLGILRKVTGDVLDTSLSIDGQVWSSYNPSDMDLLKWLATHVRSVQRFIKHTFDELEAQIKEEIERENKSVDEARSYMEPEIVMQKIREGLSE